MPHRQVAEVVTEVATVVSFDNPKLKKEVMTNDKESVSDRLHGHVC